VRRLAEHFEFSASTAWKLCRDDLSLLSYKVKLWQTLSEDGTTRRHACTRECGALLGDNQSVLYVTCFPDDVHSDMDDYIN
jgi:hypothetical protein